MKKIFYLLLLSFYANLLVSQNYISIGEGEIINDDKNLQILEASVVALKSILPSQVQNNFRVYDFSFYPSNENYDESIDSVFHETIKKVDTKYYLIIGREIVGDDTYLFHSRINLPINDMFACSGNNFEHFTGALEDFVMSQLNKKHGVNDEKIVKCINNIKTILEKNKECCLKPTSCFDCIVPILNVDNDYYYDPFMLFIKMLKEGFSPISVIVTKDDDFIKPKDSTALVKSDTLYKSDLPLNIRIKFEESEEDFSLDEYVNSFSSGLKEYYIERLRDTVTVSIKKLKFPRDLCAYDTKYLSFYNDNSEIKVFFAIIHEGKTGFLLYKIGGSKMKW